MADKVLCKTYLKEAIGDGREDWMTDIRSKEVKSLREMVKGVLEVIVTVAAIATPLVISTILMVQDDPYWAILFLLWFIYLRQER